MENNINGNHMETDVVIIGAGPAGLRCAARIAGLGFKTIVLERRSGTDEVNPIIVGAVRIDNLLLQEKLKLTDEAIYFPGSDFSLNRREAEIAAPNQGLVHWAGNGSMFGATFQTPFFIHLNVKYWLKKLCEKAVEAGAVVLFGHEGTELIRKNGKICGVAARSHEGENIKISARYTVAADGACSRISRQGPFNRTPFPEATGVHNIGYIFQGTKNSGVENGSNYIKGAKNFYWGSYYCGSRNSFAAVTPMGNDIMHVGVYAPEGKTGWTLSLPEQLDFWIKYLTEKSSLREVFKDAKPIKKCGAYLPYLNPIEEPFTSDMGSIGDAAMLVEMVYAGSMQSGWRAGDIVEEMLKNGSPGPALADYLQWWKPVCRKKIGLVKFMVMLSTLDNDDYGQLFDIMGCAKDLDPHRTGLEETMKTGVKKLLEYPYKDKLSPQLQAFVQMAGNR